LGYAITDNIGYIIHVMQPKLQNNVIIPYQLKGLTPIFFENYSISCVSILAKEKINNFIMMNSGKPALRVEGKIVEKTWKELPSQFPGCMLGNYALKPDEFIGIISIDNSSSSENSSRLMPKILSAFKARSTKLLNLYHGSHGRVFWENNFREYPITNFIELRKTLKKIDKY
jgi:hypothetical protein